MNSYYVFFQKGKNTNISNHLKRWEHQFSKFEDILGFIHRDIFQEGNIVENLINSIQEKKPSFENVYELVFLPLIIEENTWEETYLQLKQIQKQLKSKITSDRLANVYLFPLVKLRKKESNPLRNQKDFKENLAKKFMSSENNIKEKNFLPFFLFQDERMSISPYSDKNWLSDVEHFINFLPIIENKGLHFFNYFPNFSEKEIASFTSNVYFSQKFLEIRDYLNQSLNKWISYQITEDKDCREVLIDPIEEINKIKKIGLEYTETESDQENKIIEKFKFFNSLSFSTIKNNLDELKQINIDEKITDEASDCEPLLKKTSLLEYRDRVSKLKKIIKSDSETIISMIFDKLKNGQSTLNCLIKESENNLEKSLAAKEIGYKFFKLLVNEKIKELNLKGLFNSVLQEMSVYLKGVTFRKKVIIFFFAYILSFAIIYQLFNMSGILINIYYISTLCFIPAISAPLLYVIYWKRKKEKKIKTKIREFRRMLTTAIKTAAREGIRNNISLYFHRFIKRKTYSINEQFKNAIRILVALKDYLLNIKSKKEKSNPFHPPEEIKKEIEKTNFKRFFSDVKNYDIFTISDFFKDFINDESERIYTTMKCDDEINLTKTSEEDLSKKATFNLDKDKSSLIFLVPDSLSKSYYQRIKEKTYYKIPIKGKAIALLIGKIKY